MRKAECYFCSEKPILLFDMDDDVPADVWVHGKFLAISEGSEITEFAIKYCPKCGRKLGETNE